MSTFCRQTWLSKLAFWWIVPLLLLGRKRRLTSDDIFQLDTRNLSNKLGQNLSKHWEIELQKKKPRLYRAVYNAFKLAYFKVVLLVAFREIICRVGQGLCVGIVLSYLDTRDGLLAYGGIILVALVIISAFVAQHLYFQAAELGMQIRVSLTTLTYNKCLVLRLDKANIGQVATLVSNDVNRFDRFMFSMCYLFVTPIQFVIILSVLWMYMGISAVGGLSIFPVIVLFQLIVGKFYNQIRHQTARKTEVRVQRTTELLSGIEWIKMSNWEGIFEQIIAEARRQELEYLRQRYMLMLSNLCFSDFGMKLIQFVILFIYEHSGFPVSAQKIFVISTLLMYLGVSSSSNFTMALSGFFESLASLQRIENFMLSEEKEEDSKMVQAHNASTVLELTKLCASWILQREPILSDVSIKLRKGELIGVVGAIGSGKSSLFKSILRETRIHFGDIFLGTTKVAYVSQEPWIFPASLLNNILFGKPFDSVWFRKVVDACALGPDLKLLPNGVETFLGDQGTTLSGGQRARINLARAVYADADLYLLDDPLSAVDLNVAKLIKSHCIDGLLKSKATLLVTHQEQHLDGASQVLLLREGRMEATSVDAAGQLEPETIVDDLEVDDPTFLSQSSDAKSQSCHKYLGHSSKSYGTFPTSCKGIEAMEDQSNESLNYSTYWKYWTAGGLRNFYCLAAFFTLTQLLSSGGDYWLKIWAHETYRVGGGAMTYLVLVLGFGVAELLRNIVFTEVVINSNRVIHESLLRRILRAPLQFFKVNTAGRAINRFANDVGVMDDFIPGNCMITLNPLYQGIGSLVSIAIVIPFSIIPACLILATFAKIRQYYMPAAANLKRLEALSRSPVFSIIISTLTGIVTIRASNAQETMKREYIKLQDANSAANYTYMASPRWFCFCLECASALFATFVITFCYFTPNMDAASAGLAITCALGVTVYASQWGANLGDLESGMISVERIFEYANTESEPRRIIPGKRPPHTWPKDGRIQFKNVSVSYDSNTPVLHSINFAIEPGAKVGIIGRTGAGKSSIISSLFRLVEASGSIHIDFLDISKMGLSDLRSKMSVIPQNSILLAGSLRLNLDPFGRCTDSELVEALQDVNLDHRFKGPHKLDTLIGGDSANLSHGERQLLCLARAMLQRTRILVLDEATAHVDTKTDKEMQRILRTKFKHRTVITIAHRVSTVIDNDKIIVVGNGRIIEFDHPHILLQNPDGYLFKLCQKAGPKLSAQLRETAKSAYHK